MLELELGGSASSARFGGNPMPIYRGRHNGSYLHQTRPQNVTFRDPPTDVVPLEESPDARRFPTHYDTAVFYNPEESRQNSDIHPTIRRRPDFQSAVHRTSRNRSFTVRLPDPNPDPQPRPNQRPPLPDGPPPSPQQIQFPQGPPLSHHQECFDPSLPDIHHHQNPSRHPNLFHRSFPLYEPETPRSPPDSMGQPGRKYPPGPRPDFRSPSYHNVPPRPPSSQPPGPPCPIQNDAPPKAYGPEHCIQDPRPGQELNRLTPTEAGNLVTQILNSPGPIDGEQRRQIHSLLGDKIRDEVRNQQNEWTPVDSRRSHSRRRSHHDSRPRHSDVDSEYEEPLRDKRVKRSRKSKSGRRAESARLHSSLPHYLGHSEGQESSDSPLDSPSSSDSSSDSGSSNSGRRISTSSLSRRTRRKRNRRSRSPSPMRDQSTIKMASKIGVAKRVVEKLLSHELANFVGKYSDDIPAAVSDIFQGTMPHDILFLVTKDLSSFSPIRALDSNGVFQFLDDLREQLIEEVASRVADGFACEAVKTNVDLRKWALALIRLNFSGTSILPALRFIETHLQQTIITDQDNHASGVFKFTGIHLTTTRVTIPIMESVLIALRPWDHQAVHYLLKSWKNMLEHCVTAAYMLKMESQLQPVCRAISNASKTGLRDLNSNESFRFGSWSCRKRTRSGYIREVSVTTGKAFREAVKDGTVGYSIKKLLDPHALKSINPEMKKAFEKDGAAQILRSLQDKCTNVPTGPGITNSWTEEEVNRVTYKNVPSWQELSSAIKSENVRTEGQCTNTLCFSSGCKRDDCQFASSHESTRLLPVGVRARIFEKAKVTKPST